MEIKQLKRDLSKAMKSARLHYASYIRSMRCETATRETWELRDEYKWHLICDSDGNTEELDYAPIADEDMDSYLNSI